MQLTTELNEMFSYSLWPILLFLVIIIFLIIIYIFKIKTPNKQMIKINKVTNSTVNLNKIKSDYLHKIDSLVKEVKEEKIANRAAYLELSKIIRKFVYKVTNIKVQNYTLKEIRKINIPILSELVLEYYQPEFAQNEKGNILKSIEKTREVIEKWH